MAAPSCAMCGKAPARACGCCKRTHYCGKNCQAKDWRKHKQGCNWCKPALLEKVRKLLRDDESGKGVTMEHGKSRQKVHLRSEPWVSPHLKTHSKKTHKERLADAAGTLKVSEFLRSRGMSVNKRATEPPPGILVEKLEFVCKFGKDLDGKDMLDMFADRDIMSQYRELPKYMLIPDPKDAVMFNSVASKIAGGVIVYGPVLFLPTPGEDAPPIDPDDVCVICQEGGRNKDNSISFCGDQRHALHMKCALQCFNIAEGRVSKECPSCRASVTPSAAGKLVVDTIRETDRSPCLVVMERVVLGSTPVEPASAFAPGISATVHVLPDDMDSHLQLANICKRANDNRAEAVFLLDTPPCYVVMTGIKLKKGATPICKVVPKPEEDKKDKKKKDKKKN